MNKKQTRFKFEYTMCNHMVESKGRGPVNVQSPQVQNCAHHKENFTCSICLKEVHGLMLLCPKCYHGGHFKEIYEWFTQKGTEGKVRKKPVFCPVGCDHQCFSFD